jgi:hypothetical protein
VFAILKRLYLDRVIAVTIFLSIALFGLGGTASLHGIVDGGTCRDYDMGQSVVFGKIWTQPGLFTNFVARYRRSL